MSDLNFLARKKIFWGKWFAWGNPAFLTLAGSSLFLIPSIGWSLVVYLVFMAVAIFIAIKYKNAQFDYWEAFNEKSRQERIEELRKSLGN